MDSDNTFGFSTTAQWNQRCSKWKAYVENDGGSNSAVPPTLADLRLTESWDERLTSFAALQKSTKAPHDDENESRAVTSGKIEEKSTAAASGTTEEKSTAAASGTTENAEIERLRKALCEERKENITGKLEVIAAKHQVVRGSLEHLQVCGNQTQTESKVATVEETVEDDRIDLSMVPSPSKPAENVNPLPDNQVIDDLPQIRAGLLSRLKSFSQFLCELRAVAFAYAAEEHKDNVAFTVDAIHNWEKTDLQGKPHFFAWPSSIKNNETDVDHPILRAIIASVLQILDSSESTLTNEQDVHRTDHAAIVKRRKKRRVDIMRHPTRECLRQLLPAQIENSIECKSIKSGIDKAVNQCLGHLGRRVAFSFDFAGVGENCEDVAIAISLVEIVVVVIKLSNIGTKDVDLSTSRTDKVPLLGEDGIFLLARALEAKITRAGTNALETKPCLTMLSAGAPTPQCKILEFLGSGAFSHALKVKVNTSTMFMKVPKAGALVKNIERECEALQAIDFEENGEHWSIPRVHGNTLHHFHVSLRHEIGSFSSLILEGQIGKTLSQTLKTVASESRLQLINEVQKQCLSAMKFAHDKGRVHLDPREGNLIVKESGGFWHIMVADWGSSATIGEKILFRGTYRFAHHDWFPYKRKKIEVSGKFDFAGLGYTIVSALYGCQWKEDFSILKDIDTAKLKSRREMCSKALGDDQIKLAAEIANELFPPRRDEERTQRKSSQKRASSAMGNEETNEAKTKVLRKSSRSRSRSGRS